MQTDMVLQNIHASDSLKLIVRVECNTDEETILENIRINSERNKGWQKLEDAHDGVAILCGNGPSILDSIQELKQRQLNGDVIFALNGCASFLHDHGIRADYQVILDAKEETSRLIGPARGYLFASQVHPKCFDIVPNAKLWHATHGNIAPEFPDYEDDYCLVGGSISVGNAALVLAFVRGFREIHCYGYDSSNNGGKSHARHQAMNDGEPTTVVQFMGQEFESSLTMKLQAEYFLEKALLLKREGVDIYVHGYGLLPTMYNVNLTEKQKYELIWSNREYGNISPGERHAQIFFDKFNPSGLVIDFGCGSGKGGAKLQSLGCDVLFVDFASNALDDEIESNNEFICLDLCGNARIDGDYGFCCDVMEHIPTDLVDSAIRTVMESVPKCYFQISTIDDVWGATIGHPLHLSVYPVAWWADRFKSLGYKVEWQDSNEAEAQFLITT